MREVVFKNLTSAASRKKDILLKEIFEKDGVLARTERRCFYFIKEVRPLQGEADLQRVVNDQDSASPMNKRHFHILKEHDDKTNADRVMCKIIGTFYAVVNNKVYTIAFLHSFKVAFVKNRLA